MSEKSREKAEAELLVMNEEAGPLLPLLQSWRRHRVRVQEYHRRVTAVEVMVRRVLDQQRKVLGCFNLPRLRQVRLGR